MVADNFWLQLDVTGTLTLPTSAEDPTPTKVVFQGASPTNANYWTRTGKPRQKRRHVIPADPKTPAQLARREWMAAGVLLWQTMPEEEKKAWKEKGEKRQISGFNAFTSAHLLAFKPA